MTILPVGAVLSMFIVKSYGLPDGTELSLIFFAARDTTFSPSAVTVYVSL